MFNDMGPVIDRLFDRPRQIELCQGTNRGPQKSAG